MARMPPETKIFVQYHTFMVIEGGSDNWPEQEVDIGNGLINPFKRGAFLYTGIHTGYVSVAASASLANPGEPNRDAWDEIVEVSVPSPKANLCVRAFEDEAESLPRLTHARGWHRLRVHARGRDTDIDGTADQPFEHYLIECWPEPEAPQAVHKATDRYGESRRLRYQRRQQRRQ